MEEHADDGEFDEFGRSANRSGGAGGSSDRQDGKDQSNGILGALASSSIGSSGKKRPRVWDRNRSAEDYMDDRDYEDWGGPTGVSAEYSDPIASTAIATNVDDGSQQQQGGLGLLVPTELLQSMAGPTDAIGRLLLRKLGWREGSSTDNKSSAYVPTHDGNGGDETANDKACSHEALLSKKRLKKIQLSERGHSLPPAKIDTYGLGFDPFRNAPEFAAHREQRKKRAEERAMAAGGGGGQGRYHTSDLLDDEDGDDDGGDTVHNAKARASTEKGGSNKSTNVLAYETAEDFIGRKGTAGFALEDDDDDVYDNVQVASSAGMSTIGGGHPSKFVGIGGEEYHMELIDHDSDAEGEDSSQAKHGDSVEFAGALSAWATGENDCTGGMKSATKAVTSDGRPPLDGFVLGGSGGEKDITNKRFPGPGLPPNFEPVRHVFREEDLPVQVAEQSKRAKEEAEKTRGAQSDGAATSQSYTNPQKRDDVTPMAGNAFAGLAAAMKNRFTSGGPDAGKTEDKDRIGLRMPNSMSDVGSVALAVPASKEEREKKEIQVKRSTMLWNPEPLLCKRLGVRPPSRSNTPISTQQKQTEEIYFKKEILSAAGTAAATARTLDPSGDGAGTVNAGDIGNNDVPIRPPQPGDDIGESRPPMDLFKSIFGAPSSDSDDSSSSDEDDSNGEGSAAAIGTSKDTSTPVKIPSVDLGSIGDGIGAQNNKKKADNQEATHTERYADGSEEKDKSQKYRHRSRRSRSSDSASSESESSERSSSYERRRRKKKSKRRKKERSKRHDDERKRPKDERRRKKRRKRSRSRSKSRDRGRDMERKPAKKSSRSTSGRDT